MSTASRRAIPSVEQTVQSLGDCGLPRPLVVNVVRRELAAMRKDDRVLEPDAISQLLRARLEEIRLSRIQPVINGTGVIIHTNLGRAPLSGTAADSLCAIATGYNNLEFDLASGGRGKRGAYLEQILALLCVAEASTVVNNCAAALVLLVRHFTRKKPEVIISRGELIQIGGGFRIPEILEASGARLREVGTTNQTTVDDYADAIGPETALILKVHRSNFFMGGFVESAETEALARLARTQRIPFVEDLGSGAVVATETAAGVPHEPTPAETLKRGVDLVVFSGDKLFGGPQAGIIAGKARLISALKREPFFRALRCDKLVLAALQTTVDFYLSGQEDDVPVLAMMRIGVDELRIRAESILEQLRDLPACPTVGEGNSQVGGGTLPQSAIASVTLEFSGARLDDFATRLRRGVPPVIGYIADGKFKLDLRTIFPAEDEQLVGAIRNACGRARPLGAPTA